MRERILGLVLVFAFFWGWANQVPRAHSVVLYTAVDTPVNITLVAEDPEGEALQFELLDTPKNGKLVGSPPHLTYYPKPGFVGCERLAFRVFDPHGAFDLGFVDIRISQTASALRIVPGIPEGFAATTLVEFLVQRGVRTWYIAGVEPRSFSPGMLPFLFAGLGREVRVFVVGPLQAPEIREVGKAPGLVLTDLRQALPGTYFFLVVSGSEAFSYPFRIVRPAPDYKLAYAR